MTSPLCKFHFLLLLTMSFASVPLLSVTDDESSADEFGVIEEETIDTREDADIVCPIRNRYCTSCKYCPGKEDCSCVCHINCPHHCICHCVNCLLFCAIMEKNEKIIQWALENGAQPNETNLIAINTEGPVPMFQSALEARCSEKVVELFFNAGADPNKLFKDLRNVFMEMLFDYMEFVDEDLRNDNESQKSDRVEFEAYFKKILIKAQHYGLDLSHEDEFGKTLWHYTLYFENEELTTLCSTNRDLSYLEGLPSLCSFPHYNGLDFPDYANRDFTNYTNADLSNLKQKHEFPKFHLIPWKKRIKAISTFITEKLLCEKILLTKDILLLKNYRHPFTDSQRKFMPYMEEEDIEEYPPFAEQLPEGRNRSSLLFSENAQAQAVMCDIERRSLQEMVQKLKKIKANFEEGTGQKVVPRSNNTVLTLQNHEIGKRKNPFSSRPSLYESKSQKREESGQPTQPIDNREANSIKLLPPPITPVRSQRTLLPEK